MALLGLSLPAIELADFKKLKLERLVADMEEIAASGKKAIVFSQWVHTLHKMMPSLERFGPLQYHGQIPSAKRDPILKERLFGLTNSEGNHGVLYPGLAQRMSAGDVVAPEQLQ